MSTEQAQADSQQVTTHKRTVGPGCCLSTLWFIFFGWWLLNESISVTQIAGAALVIAGILIVSRRS